MISDGTDQDVYKRLLSPSLLIERLLYFIQLLQLSVSRSVNILFIYPPPIPVVYLNRTHHLIESHPGHMRRPLHSREPSYLQES